MSLWTRLRNTLHNERLHCEIEEELESHMAEGNQQELPTEEPAWSKWPAG
jgi:hypothetical protein